MGGRGERQKKGCNLPAFTRDEKVKREATTEKFSQILYQAIALATKAQRSSLSLGAKGIGGARTAARGMEEGVLGVGWTPGRYVFVHELGGDFLLCLFFF